MGFVQYLSLFLLGKTSGETLCIVQEALLIGRSPPLPFVTEVGSGHEDRQFGLCGGTEQSQGS